MSVGDGQVVQPDGIRGGFLVRPASRWDELKHMAMEQAHWNAKVGVPSEFVLLNSSNPSKPVDGIDMVRIDAQKGRTDDQLSALRVLLEHQGPGGGTPLR